MNMIAERTKKEERKFELVKNQGEILKDLNTYFPKLMNYLYEQPKIVSLIIQNTEISALREYLAPFFANNFYENILSSYFIEDNLMYVITLLLEGEINNLTNINQYEKFLDNTPCGCFLEELRRKSDIQAFFKTIIFNSIENLQANHSSSYINFNSKDLINKVDRSSKNNDLFLRNTSGDSSQSLILEDGNITRNKNKEKLELDEFNKKYSGDLNKGNLQIEFEKQKNNKKMYDFLYTKINDCNSNNNLYSNIKLMENFASNEFSQFSLVKYQKSFMLVTNFINEIIENILNNIHIIPYSLKCICKIIFLLIKKKFPSISETEKNAFIAKFFFGNLLLPILRNPGIEAFISDFIITQNNINNLNIIFNIINKFTTGSFYKSINEENDYTPFNWYFIEKMEKLFQIFEHITKAILPSFIEKLINDKLDPDYKYDYFKENPSEVIFHRSMFFNLEQIKCLLFVIKENKNIIFTNKKTIGLEKTIEKLLYQTNQKLIDEILETEKVKQQKLKNQKSKKKDNKNETEKESEPKLHYFLITSLIYNEGYEKLFRIEQETANFSLKELKTTPDEETLTKNNIIKVKNFFCSLLYNYNKLVKTDFDIGSTENTEKILKELKNFMKSSNFVVDGTIPSEWYVTSLLEYLKKIPENLTKNDCEELYKEIINDINESIKQLDFEALSVIMGKLKFAERGKNYFEGSKKFLNDIKLNQQSKNIIESYIIPIDILFMIDDENQNRIFEINSSNFKTKEKEKNKINREKIKEYENKKSKQNQSLRLCLTIEDFTKKFPNLVKYQELQDLDIFNIQEDLNFSDKINKYMSIIKDSIKEEYKEGLKLILEKIYDYVMTKLYDKLFPIEPYEEDNKIFKQSIRLLWVEPKNLMKVKRQLILGNFLPDFLNNFKLMVAEKSPRKKLLYMHEIFCSIGFLLQFNGVGKENGVDDQLPILNYAFIKAHPQRLFSNAKFMDLYIGEKRNKIEGSQLTQLLGICEFIANIKPENLFEVSHAEYIEKCNQATSSDIKLTI